MNHHLSSINGHSPYPFLLWLSSSWTHTHIQSRLLVWYPRNPSKLYDSPVYLCSILSIFYLNSFSFPRIQSPGSGVLPPINRSVYSSLTHQNLTPRKGEKNRLCVLVFWGPRVGDMAEWCGNGPSDST